jgi:hypothetical protein
MRWLAILLLAVAGHAHAWMCDPQQIAGGTGTRAVIKIDSTGFALMWSCPDGYVDPKGRTVQMWGRWADLPSDWKEVFSAAIFGTPADREAAWKANITASPRDPVTGALQFPADLAGVVTPAWNDMVTTLPPAPVWTVAPNASYTTRPAYAVIDGVRAVTSTARATVGAACYCGLRFIEGATTYCAVTTSGAWVSVCRRQ